MASEEQILAWGRALPRLNLDIGGIDSTFLFSVSQKFMTLGHRHAAV